MEFMQFPSTASPLQNWNVILISGPVANKMQSFSRWSSSDSYHNNNNASNALFFKPPSPRHPLDTDLAVAAEFVLQSVHHRVLQHATGRPGVLPADAQWSAAAEDTERGRRRWSWWGQDFLRPAHAQP